MVEEASLSRNELTRARRSLAKLGASYGAVGACMLYVLFTGFPRSAPYLVVELGALLMVAPTTGALLGAMVPSLGRVALALASIFACFAAHVAFVRLDTLFAPAVCVFRRVYCRGPAPIPTRDFALQLLVLGAVLAAGLLRARARVLARLAHERAARTDERVFS